MPNPHFRLAACLLILIWAGRVPAAENKNATGSGKQLSEAEKKKLARMRAAWKAAHDGKNKDGRKRTGGSGKENPEGANAPKDGEKGTDAKRATTDKSKDASSRIVDDYAALTASFQQAEVEEKEIFYYQCRNVQASTLKRVLDNFVTSSGTVAASEESDLVVVQDVKPNVPRLKEIARNVDQPVPQVLVEAQIVELNLDNDFEKELRHDLQHTGTDLSFAKQLLVNLTTPGAQPTAGEGFSGTFQPYVRNYSGNKRNELTSFLRYLETCGRAKILSAPNLILRRGSEGSIVTGQDVPIQEQTVTSGTTTISTTFKRVGITLKVKPLMIRGDTVRMSVNPGVSTVTGFSGNNPIIALRNATTELEIKDGELISIGGLLRDEKRTVRKRVPIASAIPVVGHLFRATRVETVKTQLVIFITVKILQEGSPGGVVLHRPRDIPAAVHKEIEDMEKAACEERPRARILRDLQMFLRDGEE